MRHSLGISARSVEKGYQKAVPLWQTPIGRDRGNARQGVSATPFQPHATHEARPRQKLLHEVIFEADTPGGRAFDIALLAAIILSVTAVCLESVQGIRLRYGTTLRILEWIFTVLFTIEYVLRLISVRRPLRYAVSFYGIVDLLAILPTYLSVFFAGTQSLLVIRALRLLRVFRVFKLAHFLGEADLLRSAIRASVGKMIVFMGVVLSLMLILGTMMYLIEPPESGFTSIPHSIYWAIVTMTTVGYGDIAPTTVMGKLLASMIMLVGYAIIAVPTGIMTVEIGRVSRRKERVTTQACTACMAEGHDPDAIYCKHCGEAL